MNIERLEATVQRLLVIAIFCHVFRDWGVAGQLGILTLAIGWAFYLEHMRARKLLP